MKAVLYARFSPRPHAADCESCESQLTDLREYCQRQDITVVGEYQDRALSGGDDWQDRPGMLEAEVSCRRGMLFLVRAYDRLFRDTDKALAFRAMLESKGVEVRSITEEGANGDSMNAKLIRFIFLWLAEYQREITRARTKAKMLGHQANGRRMSCEPPWGYQTDPEDRRRLVPCLEEQAVTERIRGLRSQGLGLRAIGRELQKIGLLRRGKADWPHEIVKRILTRSGS